MTRARTNAPAREIPTLDINDIPRSPDGTPLLFGPVRIVGKLRKDDEVKGGEA